MTIGTADDIEHHDKRCCSNEFGSHGSDSVDDTTNVGKPALADDVTGCLRYMIIFIR